MKTIFITIFEGVEAKNILRTSILKNLLLDEDLRIVLFTKSQEKRDYYQNEFSHQRLYFEVVESIAKSKINNFFEKIKFILLRTDTTNLKRKMAYDYSGGYLKYHFVDLLNFILARPTVRVIVRYLDYLLVADNTFDLYFDKYSPSIVFMGHLFDNLEINLLRAAKKRGITTIGYINSWDKVTSRCIIRILPDKAIVFNNIVKNELISFNEMTADNIFVSGLPQYDIFYDKNKVSREVFFKEKGFDINKKLIVYAPIGRSFGSSDWDIIDLLTDLIYINKTINNCELLVRFQPNDFINELEISKRPNLKYDVPGIRFGSKRGVDWDMNNLDIDHLCNTLQHMSLLICYASSISIDAAVNDKPIININFELTKSRFLLKSSIQHYQSTHYKAALNTGGISLVNNKEELIIMINKYLENPELNRRERSRLVMEQCSFIDGKSGKRIANYMIDLIK